MEILHVPQNVIPYKSRWFGRCCRRFAQVYAESAGQIAAGDASMYRTKFLYANDWDVVYMWDITNMGNCGLNSLLLKNAIQ